MRGRRFEEAPPSDSDCLLLATASLASTPARPILHIAVVDEFVAPVLSGLGLHPDADVALLHTKADRSRARSLQRRLARAGTRARLVAIHGAPFEGIVGGIGEIAADARLSYTEVYVNVSAGSAMAGCAATTAAFVHGLRAFGFDHGEAFVVPSAAFGYRELVGPAKLSALSGLAEAGAGGASARSLQRQNGWTRDDLDAHLFGNGPERGLADRGLVALGRGWGLWRRVRLTPAARLLLATRALPTVVRP